MCCVSNCEKKCRDRDENGGISRWNMSGMMHLVKEASANEGQHHTLNEGQHHTLNEGQHHTLRSTYYFW